MIGAVAQRYSLNGCERLTHAEQFDLAVQYRETGDITARNRLVSSMMDFVVVVVEKIGYRDTANYTDLIQQGALGAMHACDLFDPAKEQKFKTYAWWWIRQFVFRYLAQDDLVRLPTNYKQVVIRIRKIQSRLLGKLGRKPTLNEIAAEIGTMTERQVRFILERPESNWRFLSTDAPLSPGGETPILFGDWIPDSSPLADELFETESARNRVHRAIDSIKWTQREKDIIELRILADEGNKLSLKEIGEMFGITRERIRQVQNDIIRRIGEQLQA
jgi:RNA polymerase sigma factor (sigma-70 family)